MGILSWFSSKSKPSSGVSQGPTALPEVELRQLHRNKDVQGLIDALERGREESAYSLGFARCYAALALGDLGDSRALGPLIRTLDCDPNLHVRTGAAQALGELGGPGAREALQRALRERPLPPHELFKAVIESLRKLDRASG
jgi:HEAT repeat protein